MWLKVTLLAIGIVVVLAVMSLFGLEGIMFRLSRANLLYILLAIAVELLMIVSFAIRMKIIASPYKFIGLRDSFNIVMAGFALNFLTPIVKIGGEPVKIYMLKRRGMDTSTAGAVVATDTLVEIVSIYVVIFMALFIMILTEQLPETLVFTFAAGLGISLACLAAIFTVIMNKKLLKKVVGWIARNVAKLSSEKMLEKANKTDYAGKFSIAFRNLLHNKKRMTGYYAISFINKILEFLRMWIIFLALGAAVPFQIIIFVWSVILILSMVPGLPGNLGIIEAGGAGAYVLFGVTGSISASNIILDRFISFWLILVFGLIIIWAEKLQDIKKDIRG